MISRNTASSIFLLTTLICALAGCHFTHKKPSHTCAPASVAPMLPAADSFHIKQGLLFYKLDTYFMNRHKFNGLNGAVLVARAGNVIYQGCFGYSNYLTKDSLHLQTPFHLASTSKPFTAAAIMRLVAEGKLKTTDSLRQYFPAMPYKNVTIRDLLCHRSGLPNYLYFGEKLWPRSYGMLTNDMLVKLMSTRTPLEGTTHPNTHFQYCNTNYALLACIVEKVSGVSFPEYMKETFFDPLGMTHTFVRKNGEALKPHVAVSYNSKWVVQKEDPYDGVYGDKNVYSTTSDLLKWDNAYYAQKNLTAAAQTEMAQPRSFERKGFRNYGYGWRLMLQPNGTYLQYHNGWWHGNTSVYYRYPPDSFALIILSNKFNRGIYNVQPIFDLIGNTPTNIEEETD